MRPRSDGTSSSWPAPGTAAMVFSKSAICELWMSTKKKAGASFGMRCVICSRRLPSISAVATSTVRPRPSDSMTIGVGEPGRWRLASASRSAASLGLPTRAATHISAARQQREGDEGADRAQHEPARGAPARGAT